ncbi:MAG: AMP-binding protein [Oscillospiraceae bacterium]|jgi:acetyl-CoA synthetase|nr:AMP-binding protein [Oscillospiraceae bacterium]
MEINLREVAQRMAALRESAGLTPLDLAAATNTTAEEYLAAERGETDFTFAFLSNCAKTFGVDLTDLFSGQSSHLSLLSVVRAGEGFPLRRHEGMEYRYLGYGMKERLVEPFLVTAPYRESEQTAPVSCVCHEGQELDYVLSGTLKLVVNGHTRLLHPGDTAFYDSGKPHGMIAVEGEDCVFFAVVMKPKDSEEATEVVEVPAESAQPSNAATLHKQYVEETLDERGIVVDYKFKNYENFNFAYDCVDAIALREPDRRAVVWCNPEGEEHVFSYGDLKRESDKVANLLRAHGVQKGDKVMVILKRHYQFWFTILALHKLGAVVIPATFLLKPHDVEYRCNAAGVKVLICTGTGDVAAAIDEALPNCPTVETKFMVNGNRAGWLDFDALRAEASADWTRVPTKASEPMLIYFSSGTTGNPKMALHAHTYALGHMSTAKYWHNADPNGLHFTIADTGWGKAVWGKLYGQMLLESSVMVYDFERFVPAEILQVCEKYGVTSLCCPPTMYRMLLTADVAGFDLGALKYCTTAGEAMPPEVFHTWREQTGHSIMDGFGQTETTLMICNMVGTAPKPGSMGKPLPHYHADIVDEDGQTCPQGQTGEIVIRTDTADGAPLGLFTEYYLDPARTAEAWHDGIYHTGDTAWVDEDGYIWYVGRNDDIIKSSGYRIGPFEIESVLAEHPAVMEAAVTGVPDPMRGNLVKATVVLRPGYEGTEELKKELQEFVKKQTAPYKYPRILDFVPELPKTVNGKIRRSEIRAADLRK